jgi:L,D-peptidoglycan transpeptidase YkuD (ErfK/YbiS/YcfS/YnhG family)
MVNLVTTFWLRPGALDRSRGFLEAGSLRLICMIGRSGIRFNKREGDGATPIGIFRTLGGMYRADRIRRPVSRVLLKKIKAVDGWCDDPSHRLYNQPVKRPFTARHELLWRQDGVYDILLDLNWNRSLIQKNKGSAIFLHLMRQEKTPTEGCIALTESDMRKVLKVLSPRVKIIARPAFCARKKSR